MKESLRSSSINRFKTAPSSYIAIGIMCGLFLILSAIVSFIDVSLLIFAVPLIGLPFLFASHISCYYLQINEQVNMSAFFRYFLGFFRGQFRGSFRAIISFLKSIVFYFASVFVAAIVLFLVFKAYYGDTFINAYNSLIYQYAYSSEFTYEDVMAKLYENNGLLLTFIVYISVLGIPLSMLAFIYYISFSSLSIYYRTAVTIAAPPLLKMSVNNTYAIHRHEIRKDWFKLNWPMLVLSFLGMVAGALIDIFLVRRIDLLPGFVIVGGVALLMFYLPFYFVNMETIYKKYEKHFQEGSQRAIEDLLERIQSSIDLDEEEKKTLEESLRGTNKKEDDEQ